MQKLEFIVQIPAVLSAITGFETKKFDGENPQKNKKKALKYLSEVIIGCVKQKCIEIFEIDDEANLSQVGNLKQEKFLNEHGVLKFPKLFQCKIVYKFSDELMMDLLITTRDGDRRKEVINFLGVLKLKIRNEMSPLPHEILHFDNNLHPLKISRILKNFDENLLSVEEFVETPLFEELFKQRQLEEDFKSEDIYAKMIFKDDNFFEFEKEFLSLMNTEAKEVQIFVAAKFCSRLQTIIKKLAKTYGCKIEANINYREKLISVRPNNEKYIELKINKEHQSKLVYSRDGKLYFRNHNGLVEADETTTIHELLEVPLSGEMKRIMKFL